MNYRVLIAQQAFHEIDSILHWHQENDYPLNPWKEELFKTIFSLATYPGRRRQVGNAESGEPIQ